jgi:hypothetical protein
MSFNFQPFLMDFYRSNGRIPPMAGYASIIPKIRGEFSGEMFLCAGQK